MRFVTLVYKNVTRRPIRSALTVSGMAVAVAAVVSLVGMADGFQRSFLKLYRGQGVDIVVVRARTADRMASELNESIGSQIAAIADVARVEPVLLDAISFEQQGLYGIVVQGLDPAAVARSDQKLITGRSLRGRDGRVVMLGQLLARNLGKSVGDRVEVYEGEFFDVVGVYDRHNIFENGAMIVPLPQLQDLLGQQGQVTAFNVTLSKPASVALIRQAVKAIEGLHAGVAALPTEDYVATDAKIRVATGMAWSTSAVALLVGAIGMLNTMIVSVFERTGEIGVLRAIGWRKSRIVRMIVLESSLLSAFGALLGTLLAVTITYALSRAPLTASLVSARIAPHVIAQGFMLALLIGLLGALYPAYRAARLLPTVALRNEG
jgi:putative ABC transport system permease protein